MLSESYIKRSQELAGILVKESVEDFSASNTRVPFNTDLMTQAILQGREVGILYKGDDMIAPSGKYRIIRNH